MQQLAEKEKARKAAEAEAARQLAEVRESTLQQEAEQQRQRLAEQMVEIKVTEGYSC